ncbi:MAG: hypothetical protein HN761_01130, partial [Gammaproteobacteria bacterium]|nr:hypothetical protein [Gammaproteobacteria bacterium]
QDENPEYFNDPNIRPERRNEIKSYIHGRWKQLDALLVDISERANKQLYTTNGSGAIALMTYFGVAKEPERIHQVMHFSLGAFGLGVVLAMCVTALLYHKYNSLLEGWRADTREFYSLEKLWSAEGSYSSKVKSI